MTFLYNCGILLFSFGVKVAALFNEKARFLNEGRVNVGRQMREPLTSSKKCVWVHCASLGEFEQGRPVIEAIKERFPDKKIVLTFFSPSGYEIRKNFELADEVYYLPADTSKNAKQFITMIDPEMAVFVKYEYWYHFLSELKKRKIKTYIVSAIFREKQSFFKWYGAWFKKMLTCFDWLFVQDEASLHLLNRIGINHASVTGDTRFDRVAEIALNARELPDIVRFVNGRKVIVAGSTWPGDEDILLKYVSGKEDDCCLIIAPHEVNEAHIAQIEEKITVSYARYSKSEVAEWVGKRILIIDAIGVLSSLYRYGHIAYIGGGFGKGIHNTLEAATYKMPVVFGPNYRKFKEACDLIALGGGFSISTYEEFTSITESLLLDRQKCKAVGDVSGDYVTAMRGATTAFMQVAF